MPVRTFLVAAAGAATGALATALFLTSRNPTASPSGFNAAFPRSAGTAESATTAGGKSGTQSNIVDPAGIFQYGKHTAAHSLGGEDG